MDLLKNSRMRVRFDPATRIVEDEECTIGTMIAMKPRRSFIVRLFDGASVKDRLRRAT